MRFTIKNVLAILSAVSMLALSSCKKDTNEEADSAAAGTAPTAPRPAELSQSIADIRAGRAAEAQPRLEAFINSQEESPYRAEALYLLGQALCAQDKYEDAQGILEQAVDQARDRTTKALAMLGRADCNMELKKYRVASRNYHWLNTLYSDVKALPQDEVLFKLGLAVKKCENYELADHWFETVVELYSTSPYAEKARAEHSNGNPDGPNRRVYSLRLNTYSKEAAAEAAANELLAKGYGNIQIVKQYRRSIPEYDVLVGRFSTEADAVRARTDAQLAGLTATVTTAAVTR